MGLIRTFDSTVLTNTASDQRPADGDQVICGAGFDVGIRNLLCEFHIHSNCCRQEYRSTRHPEPVRRLERARLRWLCLGSFHESEQGVREWRFQGRHGKRQRQLPTCVGRELAARL